MVGGGLRRDDEALRDLLVREPAGEQAQHLHLARRQASGSFAAPAHAVAGGGEHRLHGLRVGPDALGEPQGDRALAQHVLHRLPEAKVDAERWRADKLGEANMVAIGIRHAGQRTRSPARAGTSPSGQTSDSPATIGARRRGGLTAVKLAVALSGPLPRGDGTDRAEVHGALRETAVMERHGATPKATLSRTRPAATKPARLIAP